MPFKIILFQPEIPPNTGNIIRLCANTGCELHLIEPLGFDISDKSLRRAGLDYHEYAEIKRHADWETCKNTLAGNRIFAMTTKGSSSLYSQRFADGDAFLFGREGSGLPPEILNAFPLEKRLRLPMRKDQRSLNLANAAAVTVYEAWRQNGCEGGS